MRKVFVYLRVYCRVLLLILLRRPYKLSLLVSGGCNLRCQLCSIWKNENTVLSMEEVEELWSAFPIKPCWINISGGEPQLNRDLEAILSSLVAKGRPLLVTLTTNGYGDTSPLVRRVLGKSRNAILYVSLSVDGDEESHNAARGRPQSFARVMRTYQKMRALQADLPMLKVGISTTVSRVNLGRMLPFIAETLKHCPSLTINLAQSSAYYQNERTDAFAGLPGEELVDLLRATQRLLPKLSLDTFLKINFLDMAIRHVEGRYKPIPCTSHIHNVLVTSNVERVDCTLNFRPWPAQGASRRAKVEAIAETIRHPRPRLRVLREEIRAAGCEQGCHTPCEKYVHLVAALLSPRSAPGLIWTYLRVCAESRWPSSAARRREAQRAPVRA
jgi:MoaA/NifB/PqqE/SkfB family radical SAM enzyme